MPWLIETLDYADKAHHFWVRPMMQELPSHVLPSQLLRHLPGRPRRPRFAKDLDLVDNQLWANDYPHHEGSWPHSAQVIERTMGHLSDQSRAKILGLNVARIFDLDVPAGKGL